MAQAWPLLNLAPPQHGLPISLRCWRQHCAQHATHSFKLRVPAKGTPPAALAPLEIFCGVQLCKVHADGLLLGEVLTYSFKRTVLGQLLRGGAVPDFARAKLLVIKLEDVDLLTLQAASASLQ